MSSYLVDLTMSGFGVRKKPSQIGRMQNAEGKGRPTHMQNHHLMSLFQIHIQDP